jgi:hypothetical protein
VGSGGKPFLPDGTGDTDTGTPVLFIVCLFRSQREKSLNLVSRAPRAPNGGFFSPSSCLLEETDRGRLCLMMAQSSNIPPDLTSQSDAFIVIYSRHFERLKVACGQETAA